jgi:hypothetical protein
VAYAATYVYERAVDLPPLKFDIFNRVVLRPIEILMTVTSLWIVYIYFAVF